ncbi:uL13 family ribosomal protein [Tardisphaera miroshnichenkoae]
MEKFVPDLVYDAAGTVEGRLASITAKALMEGKKVAVVNVEKAVISKPIDAVVKWLQPWYGIHSWINPRRYSPRKFMTPEGYFRTSVRNMLPVDKPKGREAYSRLRVYAGLPSELSGFPIQKLEQVMWKGKEGNSTTLLELGLYYGRVKKKEVRS